MILLIDHLDSFTYNIVQAYQTLGEQVEVIRYHAASPENLEAKKPKLIVLGPGPGNPTQVAPSKECFTLANKGISIFGICLGLQIIGEFFGASVVRAKQAMHGKISAIYHAEKGVFTGLPQGFCAARYHSLVLDPNSLPVVLEATAWTEEKEIMGLTHRSLPIQGVQFHPESIASEGGLHLLRSSLP